MKLESIRARSRAINNGEFVRDLPRLPGLALKVRGWSSTAYQSALFKLHNEKWWPKASYADRRQGLGELLADHILLDWENLTDEGGEPLLYRQALALALCTEAEYSGFRDAVEFAATLVDATPFEGPTIAQIDGVTVMKFPEDEGEAGDDKAA